MIYQQELDQIVRAAESFGEAVFSFADMVHWPDGALDYFLEQEILKITKPASEAECDGCDERCIEKVVFVEGNKSSDTRAYIVCRNRDDMGPIAVDMEKLKRWKANKDKLKELGCWKKPEKTPDLKQNSFVKRGEYWEVVYNGKLGNYRDSKGMGYIARLLVGPNEYISAIELSQNIVPSGKREKENTPETETPINNLSVQALVEDKDLRGYHKRLQAIPDEIDKAKDAGDLAKQEKLAREKIGILEYVRQSTLLGKATKTFDGDAGKARKAVGKVINEAIEKFETDNPELFRHLSGAIQLGTQCRYAPETPQNWVL